MRVYIGISPDWMKTEEVCLKARGIHETADSSLYLRSHSFYGLRVLMAGFLRENLLVLAVSFYQIECDSGRYGREIWKTWVRFLSDYKLLPFLDFIALGIYFFAGINLRYYTFLLAIFSVKRMVRFIRNIFISNFSKR